MSRRGNVPLWEWVLTRPLHILIALLRGFNNALRAANETERFRGKL